MITAKYVDARLMDGPHVLWLWLKQPRRGDAWAIRHPNVPCHMPRRLQAALNDCTATCLRPGATVCGGDGGCTTSYARLVFPCLEHLERFKRVAGRHVTTVEQMLKKRGANRTLAMRALAPTTWDHCGHTSA